MSDEELDRLASLIAEALTRELDARARPGSNGTARSEPWLPLRVRPTPEPRSAVPPVWSAAALDLGDVAPGPRSEAPRNRNRTESATADVRAAAAGRAVPRVAGTKSVIAPESRRRSLSLPIDVTLGVSRRHLHLSESDQRALFGADPLEAARPLRQPGQFAAVQVVTVVGPKGQIEGVRVVGPARGETQLEVAASDAALLGVEASVAPSGSLAASSGGVTLVGPHGRVPLSRGVIVAGRHLHLSPDDARRWGLRDGDRLDVRAGKGAREITYHGVLVRAGPAHATELHLDEDEARAAALASGNTVRIVAWNGSAGVPKRTLVTEREVIRLAQAKQAIPPHALLTPGARDRARMLGLVVP